MTRGIDEAIGGDQIPCFVDDASCRVRAAILGVQRVLVVCREIDVLDNVDFSVLRPILSAHPERGPDGAL